MTSKGPFIDTKISPWRDVFRAMWWTAALVYVVVLITDTGGGVRWLASAWLLGASIASIIELTFFRERDRSPGDGA
ncbi:MAG: hypothetical protein AAGF91_02545 [Actinomycetota bacterium]